MHHCLTIQVQVLIACNLCIEHELEILLCPTVTNNFACQGTVDEV